MQNTEPNQPQITLGQRIKAKALKRANALAGTFDLRDCLHLESLGFSEDELSYESRYDDPPNDMRVRLDYRFRRGQTPMLSIDELTESIRDWIREVFPEKISNQILADILCQHNPDIDIEGLP